MKKWSSTYASSNIYIYVCVFSFIYLFIYLFIHLFIYLFLLYIYICIHVEGKRIKRFTHIYKYIYIYMSVCLSIYKFYTSPHLSYLVVHLLYFTLSIHLLLWYVYTYESYEGFHKWGYPNSWMVYSGKSYVDHLGVPPFQETSILCISNIKRI